MTEWQRVLDRQQGLATRRQLVAAGLGRAQLERAGLERIGLGLYRDRPPPARGEHLLSGGVPDEAYVGEVRAALLRLGDRSRAGRRTAAVRLGLDMQVEPDEIEVDVPRSRAVAAAPGLDVRTSRRTRSVLSALRRRRCTVAELRRAERAWLGVGGRAHLRAVLRWVDVNSGSVLESLLRVLLCRAGLAPPETQLVLRDPQSGAAQRVDFAWPQERLVVEADGRRWHDPQDRRDHDRRRDNTCARLGWLVLRFSWADVVHRPEQVVGAVRAALATTARA